MKLKKLLPLVPAAFILGSLFLPSGCANTTTPPSGGDKDTIPPVLLRTSPLPGTVNVPTHRTKLVFTFNEYVKIKDANGVFLSPPLEKKPKATIRGKSLEVTFESDLDSNTTYTLDLTGALADNNEGNLFQGFTLVFSTGSQIDSMCLTGQVQDCNTLMPLKGATVMLYKDQADSAVFLRRTTGAFSASATSRTPFTAFTPSRTKTTTTFTTRTTSGSLSWIPCSARPSNTTILCTNSRNST